MAQPQESGSRPSDFLDEPKKIFVALLIWELKIISEELFLGGKFSKAISSIRGLVSVLDEKSKKVLKPQLDKLIEYERNINVLKTREDAEQIFRAISSYLHKSYLKEITSAKPIRPSKERMRVPL